MNENSKYFLSGLFSYVIWGFLPVLLRQFQSYDGMEIIFYRVSIAALLLVSLFSFHFSGNQKKIRAIYQTSKKDFFIMLSLTALGGFFLVSNWVAYVYMVNHVSVHGAAVGYLIMPIITALLASFILKEKLSVSRWIAIGFSLVGCYLISHVNIHEVIYILTIACTYSFYLITQRKNTYLPRSINLCLQLVFGAFIMFLTQPFQHRVAELGSHFLFYITITAALFTVLPLILNLYALNKMTSSQLSFLSYVNPILSFIVGMSIYHEKINTVTLTAYSIFAVAIVVFNWEWIENFGKKRKQSRLAAASGK